MGLTHTVRKAENLYRISLKYGVSMESLAAYNGIKDKDSLRVGQVLKIPSKTLKIATRVLNASRPPKSQTASKSLRVIILKVACRVEASLKSKGYLVTMIRRSDVFVDLRRRAEISNKYRNCIFVSIHFNATPHTGARGAETFYVGKRGSFLAKSIQSHLVSNLKVRDRGYKFKKFSVLSHTLCPAVLVECGFISNSYERSRCKTSSYQAAAARAIVSGVERYDRTF
jgi:N-acetylmuramoyl-L-alanine amidase